MPLPLTDAELAMLHALAAPIDGARRPEFLAAVTTKLEAAGPAAIGPGALHRTAREVLGRFLGPAVGPPTGQGRAARSPELATRAGRLDNGGDSRRPLLLRRIRRCVTPSAF